MASSRSCASFFPKQTFYIMVASAARRPTELQQHQRFTNGLLLTLLYCSSTTTTMYVWLCLTLALYSLTRDASAIEYRPDTGVVPTIQLFNLESSSYTSYTTNWCPYIYILYTIVYLDVWRKKGYRAQTALFRNKRFNAWWNVLVKRFKIYHIFGIRKLQIKFFFISSNFGFLTVYVNINLISM